MCLRNTNTSEYKNPHAKKFIDNIKLNKETLKPFHLKSGLR